MDLVPEPANPEFLPWLDKAATGDALAWRELVARCHDRLRRMVAVRIDPLLQARVDPSDVFPAHDRKISIVVTV